jgi:hypothetical protein
MEYTKAPCKLLTNHAHVLLYLQTHPAEPLRKAALAIGVTERAVQLMVADLEAAGYLSRRKVGRQNQYTLQVDKPLQHPLESAHNVGDFLSWADAAEGNVTEEVRSLLSWKVGEHGSEVE